VFTHKDKNPFSREQQAEIFPWLPETNKYSVENYTAAYFEDHILETDETLLKLIITALTKIRASRDAPAPLHKRKSKK
jgi:hypothetical protein